MIIIPDELNEEQKRQIRALLFQSDETMSISEVAFLRARAYELLGEYGVIDLETAKEEAEAWRRLIAPSSRFADFDAEVAKNPILQTLPKDPLTP